MEPSVFLRLLFWSLLLPALTLGQFRDNGKTTAVQWDRNSLVINGSRVIIYSGEFHYPRLPVPELWPDIFEKFRASGFNAVSIYFFWSYHSSSPTAPLDFSTGAHDIQRMLDYAAAAGIYVIARPGPYIHGETNAGGVGLWTTTGAHGVTRSSSSANLAAWRPYVLGIGEILARNGVDKGGPVILVQHENEFVEDVHDPNNSEVIYMEQIATAFDDAGVTVPSTHNEKGMRGQSWSTDFENVGGAVNVYGLDSYPNGFDCSNPNSGFTLVRNYYQWFQNYSFTQPSYMAEFQGGAFDPWDGFGYENCALLTGTQFSNVFYKNLVSQKVTLMSFYMTYGGTNWGSLPTTVVYTSYDYGAHLSEARIIRDKMRETKLLGLFLRVSEALRTTEMISNGTGMVTNASATIYGTHLRNLDVNTGFYWVVQDNTKSTTAATFNIVLKTSLGNVTVPGVQLGGRDSKFIVTDYAFGNHILLYSSAEVFTYALYERPVLVLYVDVGQSAEFVLKTVSTKPVIFGSSSVTRSVFPNTNATKISYKQSAGKTVLQFPGATDPQIWLVDRISAWNIWAPSLTSNPNVRANQHLLVAGPYLVRSATISGLTAHLTGDLNITTTVELAAPSNITSFTWNGASVSVTKTAYGSLVATLPGPVSNLTSLLPNLQSLQWRFSDSLVERFVNYSDASWAVANHTTTANPTPPRTFPVLYPDDYGFHVGYKLYRGYFSASTSAPPTSATLTVIGGTAFGFSVWLNGVFLGSFVGNNTAIQDTLTVQFGSTALLPTGNVLFVIQDYMGHDEVTVSPHGTSNPRGVSGATLNRGAFNRWTLVGNAGGENPIDELRGIFNEGGLRAERLGWHLPAAPTQNFAIKSPLTGLTNAGIEFYTTNFSLTFPHTLDVPLAISVAASASVPARIQLYVNGYMYGKFVPHIGPQTQFPIPPGIINTAGGVNTLGVSIWAMGTTGAKLDSIKLVALGTFSTGFDGGDGKGFGFNASYIQPSWTSARQAFA